VPTGILLPVFRTIHILFSLIAKKLFTNFWYYLNILTFAFPKKGVLRYPHGYKAISSYTFILILLPFTAAKTIGKET